MQDLAEKAQAIATVLWLLPDHYTMLRLNRNGTIGYFNELEHDDTKPHWRPPVMEEFEGWPAEKVLSWFRYQRGLSKKYRLHAVGLAMQKLEKEHREWAVAVVMQCVEDGIFTWYEPERVSERCKDGLRFMAEDVPGDVPWFQEAVVNDKPRLNTSARNKRICEMAEEGISKAKIARELRCSKSTVQAVLSGQRVRSGRMVSAGSGKLYEK